MRVICAGYVDEKSTKHLCGAFIRNVVGSVAQNDDVSHGLCDECKPKAYEAMRLYNKKRLKNK